MSYIIYDEKYPELWEHLNMFPYWSDVLIIIGYDRLSMSLPFYEYIAENEHLHEEWILKIKMKLL